MTSKLIFREDDCLINGRDPDYRGIHAWWPERFAGRKFVTDWDAAVETEVDHGDSFTRTICMPPSNEVFEVTYSFDGYSVRQLVPEPHGLTTGPVTTLTIEDLIGHAPWPNIDDLGQLYDSSEDEEVTLP